MSFYLQDSEIGCDSPLIKANERIQFVESHSLLAAAKGTAAQIGANNEIAQTQGYDAGFAQGLADGEARLISEIAKLSEALAAIRIDHEARVAEAAFAASTAIIGTLDDADIVRRIVANQLATRTESDAIRITVAPQMAAAVSEQLAGNQNVEIVADADLAGTDCRMMTGDGRIVADLSLQLETLRHRWGLAESAA